MLMNSNSMTQVVIVIITLLKVQIGLHLKISSLILAVVHSPRKLPDFIVNLNKKDSLSG